MSRALRTLVVGWPWVLSLLVCAPLLAPGYVLTYDMVWVPDLALRADTLGLGSALPRAVPSDAVVALLDEVVPGQILQKLVLVGALGLAGTGMARLWGRESPAAAMASASLYVWNPYVAERLVIGHWPLLVAYAALPWLIASAWDVRQARAGAWPRLALALVVTSLTPATGLAGVLAALCCGVDLRGAGRARRVGLLLGLGVAANATWICAGLTRGALARSDAGAAALFEVRGEGVLGRVGSLLTLGGIWNPDAVPASRTTLLGAVGALLVLAVIVLGAASRTSRQPTWGLSLLALFGLTLALSGWLAPDVVGWLSSSLPGGGLLRDGTRYLILVAPLEALLFGAGVRAVCAWGSRRTMHWLVSFGAVAGALMPLAVLPDLAWGVAGRLTPVSYPASWHEAHDLISVSPRVGDAVVLPFSSYRAPAWNDYRPVLDPAGRFFDRTTVVNDDLVVSGQTIEGEDLRARQVQRLLDAGAGVDALAPLGIGLVVESAPADEAPGGLRLLAAPEIEVRAVAAAVIERGPRRSDIALVAVGWVGAVGTTLLAAGSMAGRRLSIRRAARPDVS
jgi:hypothetical protein